MIALAGILNYQAGKKSNIDISSQPRWPLDEEAPFMKGAGLIYEKILLVKSEPNVWSIDQQKRAGAKGTLWDGVRNYGSC